MRLLLLLLVLLLIDSIENEMLGDECQSHDQCRRTPVDGSRVCFLNQCQCSPGFVPIDSFRCIRDLEISSNNDEIEPPGFGSMCSSNDDCRHPQVEFECTRGTCVCRAGYVPLGKYLCYHLDGNDQQEGNDEHLEDFVPSEKRSLGGPCSSDAQCSIVHSECLAAICSCRRGYFPLDDWTCVEDSDHSDDDIPTTTDAFRWWPWSSTSSSTTTTTTAASTLVEAKKTFRFRCLLNRQCLRLDVNSQCTLFGRCVCKSGFHLQLINGDERCVEDDCD